MTCRLCKPLSVHFLPKTYSRIGFCEEVDKCGRGEELVALGADSIGYRNNGYIKSVTSPPVGCKEGVCKILGD